jgi:DNA-binding NarL/FixJ family response regulator
MTVTVLIVDQNEVARRFVARVIRDSFSDALEVVEFDDATAALRRLAAPAAPGDASGALRRLLVADIDLPDDGAATLLAAGHGDATLKVVTSLYADDEKLFPVLLQGADGYLLKEDRFEVQVEQLQKIARGEPPISPALARRLQAHFGPTPPAPADAAPDAGADAALSPPESELLGHLSKGYTIREVAQLMSTRTYTVAAHIRSVYLKLHRAGRKPAALAG